MTSSWASAPRCVWSDLPGVRTSVCIRPFGSVSWTRSPGLKSTVTVRSSRGRPLCRFQQVAQIGAAQDAEDLRYVRRARNVPGGPDDQVVPAGVGLDRSE